MIVVPKGSHLAALFCLPVVARAGRRRWESRK